MNKKEQALKWLENSQKLLDNPTHYSDAEFAEIKEELLKRQLLVDEFTKEDFSPTLELKNIEGTYNIIGYNQDATQSMYAGFLHLSIALNDKVNAEWVIDGEQTQIGVGVLKEDVLTIDFSYRGEDDVVFKGVVVYTVLNEGILNGVWSEEFGDDAFLGFEGGRKLKEVETISYQSRLN